MTEEWFAVYTKTEEAEGWSRKFDKEGFDYCVEFSTDPVLYTRDIALGIMSMSRFHDPTVQCELVKFQRVPGAD